VGSATTSVSSAHPDIITKAVDFCRSVNIPLIVGAGIHSKEDVKKSLELGASGFAVASDIMKAENPKTEVEDLLGGYN
jgi:triosephosphate isomerase